jgi:hypothetical protein
MERSKQIQIGILAVVVLSLIGVGIKSWFDQSEGDKIRQSAASMENSGANGMRYVNEPTTTGQSNQSGNIPGTNLNQQTPQGPTTLIRYDGERFDFGVADEGEVVKHTFKFTNVGKDPLLINNAKGSCGCTVPTWPKEAIPPGGIGEIRVEFNTKGKPGMQSKRVTVTANTNPTETFLEIKGEVRGKDQTAKGKK